MANTIMASIYNHYMTAYTPRSDARLDSHKKSELKDICSNILKMNKEAPLYILDHTNDTKSFAISLKEDARRLQHTIMHSVGSSQNELFKNNVAFSSNENILTAEYIGGSASFEDIPTHHIEVLSLASAQVNVGNFLNAYDKDIPSGNYSFDVTVNGMSYVFQHSVTFEESNYDVQNKLAKLINQSNIGLNATLVEGINNTYALRIASTKTGSTSTEASSPLFTLTDHSRKGSVNYLGLDSIMNPASNARFLLDGEEHTSTSNHFTIGSNYLINLFSSSKEGEDAVSVGVKPNTESLKHNIHSLINGYNSFLQAMGEYHSTASATSKLIREVSSISNLYYNELDAIGINKAENGSLLINEDLLNEAAESDEAADLLAPLKDFSHRLYHKSENISRDPLHYADKVIVAYKNPGKNFPSPYATSSYSGLLFNYYC